MNRSVLLLTLFFVAAVFLNACTAPDDSGHTKADETMQTEEHSETLYTETIPLFTESPIEQMTASSTTTEMKAAAENVTERISLDGELVRIRDYIPDAEIDLRYATTNNFTGTVIYDDVEAYLCYGTVKKLSVVQEALRKKGLCILIWDAYRSESAQYKLWEVCPNPVYVADPRNGLTSHSRGNTIDIGLVYADGSEVELPSAFDEFSKLADREYSDVSEKAAENSRLLEEIMTKYGFKGYWGEWWDYSDTETYDLIFPD